MASLLLLGSRVVSRDVVPEGSEMEAGATVADADGSAVTGVAAAEAAGLVVEETGLTAMIGRGF